MRRTVFNRRLAGVLMLWLGLLQFPLPSPLRAPDDQKDTSVPFPCMHSACGCANAEQCWTSCCCTTREERIAWAKEHLGAVPVALQESAAPKSCSLAPARSTCQHRCESSASTCCETASADSDCRTCGRKSASSKAKQLQGGRIAFRDVLRCRGLTAGWSIFSIAIPQQPARELIGAPQPAERVCSPESLLLSSIPLPPPSPPPRAV
ncbi:MAG: hypothetical protein KF774_04130 [Planctomyces sp.]|nr:hypothetical protein [Planctomyces sp.]